MNFDEEHGAGWMLMRLSVHDPVLPINIESDKVGGVAVIQSYLEEFLATQTGLQA